MLRSMYSGISGMKVNQTKLDVVGNNLANVGTTAFKGSRVTFSDMLSQSSSNATSASLNMGGTNAKQVGLGVQLSSIDRVMTQGNMQSTGRALDVAIDGDGFFMVSRGPVISGDGTIEVDHRVGAHTMTSQSLANSGSEIMYSRDGSFVLDEQGNLLTADGYRVMGYSLTNDDSSQSATGKTPSTVSVAAAGIDVKFGPGSQLNGYKVVLGSIGPGTVTSADIDKVQKTIIVNGDFSTPGALTAAQIETAINKGLSSAGISQQAYVNGKPVTISGLGSESIIGGTDATSPSPVTAMGATFTFGEGTELNNYVIKVGEVDQDKPNVVVNKADQTITINANFIEAGAVTAQELGELITSALRKEGIKQEVIGTGIISQVSGLNAQVDESGTDRIAPSDIDTGDASKPSFSFEMSSTGTKGAELNGYKFVVKEDDEATTNVAKIDKSAKTITITAGTKNGQVAITDATFINDALSAVGLEDIQINSMNIPAGYTGTTAAIKGGLNDTAPKSVTVAGMTIKFPKGSQFNNFEFQISDLDNLDGDPIASVDPKNNKRIILKGDFRNQNVDAQTLEDAINRALGLTADDEKVTVSGAPKAISGITSSAINGGQENSAPGTQSAFGMTFEFGVGSALNGYKINIGQVTAGTKTEAKIDEKSKTITINGDFVNQGAVTVGGIQSALSVALQDKGIDQSISVSGNIVALTGTESVVTNGGTPVQSLDTDGTVNFVDATQDLKSYDGSLKTLKIPDKVKIPGTDTELRVKSYTIDTTGVINGILEDGRVAALGQIAMASFKNPEGLTAAGGNLYSLSANSGDPVLKSGVGTINDDNSAGYGDNLQAMLEMSNVDLAEQFTDMIVTTKAFQAAGKMITTGDEILQDIINLKR